MIWYEDEVKRVEHIKRDIGYQPKTVFYGSSSIRMWESLYKDFKPYYPVNLGFGGSTLAACVWFFDRIMKSLHPDHLIVYAGDNDLGDGRNPEEVYIFFQQFLACFQRSFGDVPLTFISIKPSPARKNLGDKICYTNKLIKQVIDKKGANYYFIDVYSKMADAAGNPKREFFDADGLHLSSKGYALWKDILLTHISLNVETSLTHI
jgi:lysophospholipase L1-like esterase